MDETKINNEETSDNQQKSNSRRNFIKVAAIAAGGTALAATISGVARIPLMKNNAEPNDQVLVAAAKPIKPTKITPFIDPLVIPPALTPDIATYPGTDYYQINITQGTTHKFYSALPATTTHSYFSAPPIAGFHYLGPTIIAQKGRPVKIKVTNNLNPGPHLINGAMDYTISGNTDPSKGAGMVVANMWTDEHRVAVHLHGARTNVISDGGPRDWFSPVGSTQANPYPEGAAIDPGLTGSHTYDYPNDQPAAFLWYHDHAWGITRFNPFLGQAAAYIIRDTEENNLITSGALPNGAYEVPIVLQDKLIDPVTGAWIYPITAVPGTHPIWIPEYFGNIPVINGTAYPFLNVEPRRYRFKFLNGSNARFYNMSLPDPNGVRMPIWVIASDQGFLPAPQMLTTLLIAPGERFDAIIDFTGLAPGTILTLRNNAKAPYPGGRGGEISKLMQFNVVPLGAADVTTAPAALTLPTIDPPLAVPAGPDPLREIVLSEIMDPLTGAPLEALLDGQPFAATFPPNPPLFTETNGAINDWQFINTTGDAHPMHTHLVKFQIVSRQAFDSAAFLLAWDAWILGNPLANPPIPPRDPAGRPSVTQFLKGAPIPPALEETGWKDTAKAYPGEVLRIRAKFDLPTDAPAGTNIFVCHCHILEHEENDMMFYFGVNKP